MVCMLVLGPFQPLIAQAQTYTGNIGNGSGGSAFTPTFNSLTGGAAPVTVSNTIGNGSGVSAFTTTGVNAAAVGGTGTVSNSTLAATPQQSLYNSPYQCNWTSNWDLCLTNVVYVFTVGIGSSFAYVAASFFNLAVNLSLNGPIYALTFISTGWTTARDLANMAFLFILIYIAFMLIFEAETSHTMSLLAGVIVIALLVNFSFFFTRLVIDAGNILSIQFYNSIQAPSIQSTAQTSNVAAGVNTVASSITGAQKPTKDLTASIMGMLQLQNLFNTTSFQNFYCPQGTNCSSGQAGFLTTVITLSFLYIGAAIMFYLLTVMFVTVGIKFLVRIVILWFLIIASPLAFVARAMPDKSSLRHYYKDWQDMLISHAFYPVAFLFIFLILTNFTNQMGSCTNSGGTSSQSCLLNDIFTSLPTAANGGTSSAIAVMGLAFANVAIRLGFVIAVLYLGLKAADSVSVMGAGAASKAGNWAGRTFRASTLGLASRAGGYGAGTLWQQTGGRLAAGASNALAGSQWANRVGTPGGILGYRLRRNVTEPLANTSLGTGASSFRERQSFLDARAKEMNTNKEIGLAKIKNREDAKKLAEIDEKWDSLEKKLKAKEDELTQLQSLPGNPINGTRVIKKQGEIADFKEKEMDPLRSQREQLMANVTKMEGSQVTVLAGKDLEKIIKHISDKQMKAIKESLKYNRTEKETLERKWNETSTKAPLGESKEQLKKLGELHTQLQTLHVDLKTLGSAVKPVHGTTFNVNLGSAKKMKKEIEDSLEEQEKIRDDKTLNMNDPAERAERTRAGLAAKQLKKALEKITKLEEQVKDIPKDVGGTNNEGEFKVEGK